MISILNSVTKALIQTFYKNPDAMGGDATENENIRGRWEAVTQAGKRASAQ